MSEIDFVDECRQYMCVLEVIVVVLAEYVCRYDGCVLATILITVASVC